MDLPIVDDPPEGYEQGSDLFPFRCHPTETGWAEMTSEEIDAYLGRMRVADVVLVRVEGPFDSNYWDPDPETGALSKYPPLPFKYEIWYKPLPPRPDPLDAAFKRVFGV